MAFCHAADHRPDRSIRTRRPGTRRGPSESPSTWTARSRDGTTRPKALGQHFALIVPEPALPQVDAIFQALACGTVHHSRNLNVRKDGGMVVCQWYNAVLCDEDGVVRLIYCEVRDVTDEEELRRRQQLLQARADHSPLAIFAKDLAGRYLSTPLISRVSVRSIPTSPRHCSDWRAPFACSAPRPWSPGSALRSRRRWPARRT